MKKYERNVTYIMLALAVAALTFDVVRLEDGFVILDRIKGLLL